ncbi:hypothetical protein [Priestia megaterium]|uniref:hypothetical protein n=1 Tax=Priestia megaterium TaxID=1404 RepID=UPI003CC50661
MASNSYLYDSNGWKTSSRKDVDGTPVMDVYNKGSFVKPVTLQNAATAVGNGTEFPIESYSKLNIKATGTATSFTVVFEAAHADGVYEPVMGIKMATFDMSNQMTTKNESYQLEVAGYATFRARVTAVVGGNVSVKGNAVS